MTYCKVNTDVRFLVNLFRETFVFAGNDQDFEGANSLTEEPSYNVNPEDTSQIVGFQSL